MPEYPSTMPVSYPGSMAHIEIEASLPGVIVPKVRNREPQPKNGIKKRKKNLGPAYSTRSRRLIQVEDLNRSG